MVRKRDGGVFHCSAWAAYRCSNGRGTPLFFRWFSKGASEPLAVALAIQQPPTSSARGRLLSRVCFDGPPAGADETSDHVESLRMWSRRKRAVVELQLGSFDARVEWSGLTRVERRLEFVLRPGGDAPILHGMRKGTRSAISRARRQGVTVRHGFQDSDFAAFAGLYGQTLERLERTKGIAAPSVDVSLADRLALLVGAGCARLYVASLREDLVAGCLFGCFGTSAYYLLNGADDRGRDAGATPLILLAAFEELRADGMVRINLGGVAEDAADASSPNHGLYEFKLGLGADPVICCGGAIVTRALRNRVFNTAIRIARR